MYCYIIGFFCRPTYGIGMILKNKIEQESTNDQLFVISPQAKDMISCVHM